MNDRRDLELAVGRLILGKVMGEELMADEIELLRAGIVGGITLFRENAVDLDQLAGLVQAVRGHLRHEPIIAVDQEGGAVQRFDHVLSPLPSAMALAATGDIEAARAMAELSARQLSLLGINCLLNPVLDVLTNSLNPVICTRSFGSDPKLVREFGLTVCRALESAGVIGVGKHFPGHGDTLEDSHLHLAVNRADAKTLWQRELVPFRACLQHLPAVLTGHIWLPAIDSEMLPASLSERATSGLLRHYLGFDGLVFTDDLLMQGVLTGWGLAEASVRAVCAGADILLVCGDSEQLRAAHAAIVEAVVSGRIHESVIHKSQQRIAAALSKVKERQTATAPESSRLETLLASIESGRQQSKAVSQAAISVLRGSLPDLSSGTWIVLAPEHPRYSLDLARHLAATGPGAEIVDRRYPLDPEDFATHKIATACSGKNVVYLTFRALRNHGQVDLALALPAACKSAVAVVTDVPYDLIGLHGWENCIATFDPSDLAMEALAAVLAGKAQPAGKCPVNMEINL